MRCWNGLKQYWSVSKHELDQSLVLRQPTNRMPSGLGPGKMGHQLCCTSLDPFLKDALACGHSFALFLRPLRHLDQCASCEPVTQPVINFQLGLTLFLRLLPTSIACERCLRAACSQVVLTRVDGSQESGFLRFAFYVCFCPRETFFFPSIFWSSLLTRLFGSLSL